MSVPCPTCGSNKSRTLNSRNWRKNTQRRLRECQGCKETFVTIEMAAPKLSRGGSPEATRKAGADSYNETVERLKRLFGVEG